MNLTRVALAGLVAACAWAAWATLSKRNMIDTHVPMRQLVIGSTLARVDDAIVILGDSIVEASNLPRSLCGHPIVNAGIGRASTASNLGWILADALGDKRAALIVVALGTNDAVIPHSVERYRSNYRALLGELATLAPRRAIAAIPPPEAGFEEAKKVSAAAIDSYNAILPALAEQARALFIPMPGMPEKHTIDGIHLNPAGYEVWEKAILAGIEPSLCKSS